MLFRKTRKEFRDNYGKLRGKLKDLQTWLTNFRQEQRDSLRTLRDQTRTSGEKLLSAANETLSHLRHSRELRTDALETMPLRKLVLESPRSLAVRHFEHRCRSQYLGSETAVAQILGNHFIFVDTTDVGFGPHMLLKGHWEYWMVVLFCRLVSPGMVFVDIGANFGFFSVLANELVGPKGLVYAFEPNPNVVLRLKKTFAVNGIRGEICDKAAWSADGLTLDFVVPENEPKNGCVVNYRPDLQFPGSFTVPSIKLDTFLGDRPIDIVKIDAEGGEYHVWKGMSAQFEKNRRLVAVVEVNYNRNYDCLALLREALAMGLESGSVDNEGAMHPFSENDLTVVNPDEDWMIVLAFPERMAELKKLLT